MTKFVFKIKIRVMILDCVTFQGNSPLTNLKTFVSYIFEAFVYLLALFF